MFRLLTESEVTEFKADGVLKPGRCLAVEEGIAPEDKRTPVLMFCDRQRVDYTQTCAEHRGVRLAQLSRDRVYGKR